MTVGELINELSKYDQSIDVRFVGESDVLAFETIGKVSLQNRWADEYAVYLQPADYPPRFTL